MPPSSCAKEISGGGRQYAADCWLARRRPRIPQNAIGTVAAALHATSAEENRDATFDAGTEALHLFKCWAFFAGEALRGFLSATLRNAGHLHSFFLERSEYGSLQYPRNLKGTPRLKKLNGKSFRCLAWLGIYRFATETS